MINEPLEGKQKSIYYNLFCLARANLAVKEACSSTHLVKGLQSEVQPLLSAPLLAPRGPGLSRFSLRGPAGRLQVRGGQRSPCRRGSLCSGGGNPRLQEKTRPEGLAGRQECSESLAGLLRRGCGAGFTAVLRVRASRSATLSMSGGHAFKIKNKKPRNSTPTDKNPSPTHQPKPHQATKLTKTPTFVLRAANSPKGDPSPQHEMSTSSPRKETAPR